LAPVLPGVLREAAAAAVGKSIEAGGMPMDESRAGGQNLTPARAMLKEQADAAGIWLHPRVWLVAPDEELAQILLSAPENPGGGRAQVRAALDLQMEAKLRALEAKVGLRKLPAMTDDPDYMEPEGPAAAEIEAAIMRLDAQQKAMQASVVMPEFSKNVFTLESARLTEKQAAAVQQALAERMAEAIDRELLENQRTFTSGDSDQRLRGFIESQGLEITVRTPVRFIGSGAVAGPPPAPRPALTPTRRKYR